jgi:ubiquinone biosynthesis protein UbiJ
VAQDLFEALLRYHRDVFAPELQQRLDEQTTALRSEMLSGFDGIYKRIGILETEMVLMRGAVRDLEKEVAGLKHQMASVEARLARIEEKVDHLALASEVAELKEQVEMIQQRITELETLLNEH